MDKKFFDQARSMPVELCKVLIHGPGGYGKVYTVLQEFPEIARLEIWNPSDMETVHQVQEFIQAHPTMEVMLDTNAGVLLMPEIRNILTRIVETHKGRLFAVVTTRAGLELPQPFKDRFMLVKDLNPF